MPAPCTDFARAPSSAARWGLLIGGLWLALQASAGEAPAVEVTALGHGEYRIHAEAEVRAPAATVWQTLLDYEHFPRFIPDLASTRVEVQDAGRRKVRQHWRVALLWFHVPVDIEVECTEHAPDALDVRLLSGDLKRLDGGYRLGPSVRERTPLRWDGTVGSSRLIPAFLSTPILRRSAERQFRALVEEMERRAARAAAPPPR